MPGIVSVNPQPPGQVISGHGGILGAHAKEWVRSPDRRSMCSSAPSAGTSSTIRAGGIIIRRARTNAFKYYPRGCCSPVQCTHGIGLELTGLAAANTALGYMDLFS